MDMLIIGLVLVALVIGLHQLFLSVKGYEPLGKEDLRALKEYYEAQLGVRLEFRTAAETISAQETARSQIVAVNEWVLERKVAWDNEYGVSFQLP